MYLSFYGFQKKPFQVSTDPSFLWLGDKHKEALATLQYGNLGNQGFILLTGDVGTGKTTLINALINSLGDEVIVAKVPDPGMEIIDFMNYIAHAFGMKKKFVSKYAFLIDFDQFLNSAHAAGKKCLLIIDEAQRLSSALLEEIRQLSNIERQDTKLLSIFLVGQNEFNDVLLEHKNRALRQRIALNYVIEPLDLRETGEFIRHRLKIAGGKADVFSPDAIAKVYDLSGGFPRKVNVICDHSLLLGFGESAETITGEIVEKGVRDLLLPELPKINTSDSLVSQPSADSADSENLPERAPEPDPEPESESKPLQEVNSRKGWKTFSPVILIAVVVVIAAFLVYWEKSRDLPSNDNSNEVQSSYSSKHKVTTIRADYTQEPSQETTSPNEKLAPAPDIKVADTGAQEVLTVEEPEVEEVQPVSAVPAEEKADVLERAPILPELPDKEAGIPEDEGSVVVSSSPSTQMDTPSQLDQKNISNIEEPKKIPDISETDTIEVKEPKNLDSGALIDFVIKRRSK